MCFVDKENTTPFKPTNSLQSPFTFGKRPRHPARSKFASENEPNSIKPLNLFKAANDFHR